MPPNINPAGFSDEDPFAELFTNTGSDQSAGSSGITFHAATSSGFNISLPGTPAAMNMAGKGPFTEITNKRDKTHFGFVYEFRVPVKAWLRDPYVYRVDFKGTLIGQQLAAERPSLMYDVVGELKCPEFKMEEYFYLRKKHLLWEEARSELENEKPEMKLSSFRWIYVSTPGEMPNPTNTDTKERIREHFGRYVRTFKPMHDNVEAAIKRVYEDYETRLKAVIVNLSKTTDENDVEQYKTFKESILLKREFNAISKEHTSDLLDWLFGDRWAFYNGDDSRVEENRLLIPHWWCNPGTKSGDGGDNWKVGHGVRSGILDWGQEPYPWVLFRANRIWNDLEALIKQKVAFGKTTTGQGVVDREVYIAGLREDGMRCKKLSKKYYQTQDWEAKMEVLTSLALGELEGEPNSPPETPPANPA